MNKRILTVEGMHCDHCRAKVENALNALSGVEAKVNLKKAQATVRCPEEVTDDALIAAVTAAGFTVTGAQTKKGIL